MLATSQKVAMNAAQTIQALGITFKDTGDKAVLSLEEAIEKKHFFDLPQTVPFVIKRVEISRRHLRLPQIRIKVQLILQDKGIFTWKRSVVLYAQTKAETHMNCTQVHKIWI